MCTGCLFALELCSLIVCLKKDALLIRSAPHNLHAIAQNALLLRKVFINCLIVLLRAALQVRVSKMFSKHARPYDDSDLPPSRRFRHNAADLFLENTISGRRAATLFRDAADAGTQHVSDVASVRNKNAHRDLTRKLLRKCKWPKMYFASVRVWNRRRQQEERVEIPVLLPHEVLSSIAHRSDIGQMCSRTNLSPAALRHLQRAEQSMGEGKPILPIAVWLDGTPCNWDRSEGVETIAYSLPGVGASFRNLRLPFAVIMQKHVVTHATLDDLLDVFVWSLKHLGRGHYPARRHDDDPWHAGEAHRQRTANLPLPLRGLLVEIRGDWKCLKEVFRLPGWQEKRGCCWRCTANHETRRICSADAPWRTQRLGHWDMIARWDREGVTPSPIVAAPFFDLSLFVLDWLHVMDLGVTCDFLGNLFKLLLQHHPGNNQKERCEHLYRDMVDYYDRFGVESRLDQLTTKMLAKDAQPPKLRAKGAEARGVVDFAVEQSDRYLDPNDVIEGAARQAAHHLQSCYFCLHGDVFNHATMSENSRKFCILFAALEAASEGINWRLKPKVHLMQELCEFTDTNPSTNWTYRDEDFGGSMAGMARVRGGRGSARVVGLNVLRKFIAKHRLPSIA